MAPTHLTPAAPGAMLTRANRITPAQVEAYRAAGHVVAVYPRKRLVVIDGFKRFTLTR